MSQEVATVLKRFKQNVTLSHVSCRCLMGKCSFKHDYTYTMLTTEGLSIPSLELAVLKKHLLSHHRLEPCPSCRELISPKSMASHRKGIPCRREFRRREMWSNDLVVNNQCHNRIVGELQDLATKFEEMCPWNESANELLTQEVQKVRAYYITGLNLVCRMTAWQDYTKKYVSEWWLPREDSNFFTLAKKRHTGQSLMLLLSQWIEAKDNKDLRDSIYCILELQSENG